MYEEEDDDLPSQYRRINAHLQSNSADFNRRLAAYLTTSVAMRSAVDQMNNPYAPQYPMTTPPYTQPRTNMFQSPMLPQHQQGMVQSPTGVPSYRHAPYPAPHMPGFRQAHGRAYSTATVPKNPKASPASLDTALDQRRMSTPATIPASVDTVKPEPDYFRQTQSAHIPQQPFNPYWQDLSSPFTTSLPPEAQQMLAGTQALDPNDPFSASLLQGSEQYVNHPYYPWAPQGDSKTSINSMPLTQYGMSATLAPAALSTQADSLTMTPTSASTYDNLTPHAMDPLGLNSLHMSIKHEAFSPHSLPSGQVTPGESFWNSFVQDGSWNEDGTITMA